MSAPLVGLDAITVQRGTRVVLQDVSAGLHPGDRVGIVGRNGSGKSTLLGAIAGRFEPEAGRVTRTSGTTVAMVSQVDELPGDTVADVLVGHQPMHQWASQSLIRQVMGGLLGDVAASLLPDGLATRVAVMSGGERRRTALAAALIAQPDVLLLDEPTNHLDIEAVQWLAEHLIAWPSARRALAVVTHDRWLLDAVTAMTWQVHAGEITAFEGGYAAYVLAKAERERRATVAAEKRRNLLRKELAWLRRGAPARTSKSKFRLDAAEELITDEPPPRDALALHRVASARLGKTVLELEHLTLAPARDVAPLLADQTWGVGPGDRIGLLGPNGAGKTTLLRLLAGDDSVDAHGSVRRGKTVVPALVGQQLATVDPADRVLSWLERAGSRVTVTSGDELTAARLLEMFGFTGDSPWKRLGDLSGGERRRLHLMRTMLSGANLLMLDEPTNDLDIETLQVLEDVLDSWPGSLIVVSHDRYFLERVCDDVWAMLGDGLIRHLPGGVEEYLRLRAAPAPPGRSPAAAAKPAATTSARQRELRKAMTRIERSLDRVARRTTELHEALAGAATDPDRLLALTAELRAVESEQGQLEEEWLELGAELERG